VILKAAATQRKTEIFDAALIVTQNLENTAEGGTR